MARGPHLPVLRGSRGWPTFLRRFRRNCGHPGKTPEPHALESHAAGAVEAGGRARGPRGCPIRMGGRLRLAIRWTRAARLAGLALLGAAALAFLAGALEPPEPPPLPPDVGLGPISSSPADPPLAGEDTVGRKDKGGVTRESGARDANRERRDARQERHEAKPQPKGDQPSRPAVVREPPLAPQAPKPPPAPPPAPPAPPPPPPAPATTPQQPPPSQSEFGFEK